MLTSTLKPAYSPVPFTQVTIDDPFWTPRLTVNRESTIPTQYQQLKDTGRIDAFRLTWKPGMPPEGEPPMPHFFWDSDVAKWIEAASYSLAVHPDPELDALLDEVIALIAASQQPDGYLNSYFSAAEPENKFTDLRDAHELYCAGHLIEAAVAHYQATGKRTLLDPLRRYADTIITIFGRGPGQKRGYPGHEEIELALVKLYRATGELRYLELSKYFVDERGTQPHYFDLETETLHKAGKRHHFESYFDSGKKFDNRYNQSHRPVREQTEVVGHAVRAMYLYTAMADLAGETGDPTLLEACQRLWENVCLKRMYLTGGIGNARSNEGFTVDYDLPNLTAYAETCAAVGLVFWNQRLLQLTGDSRYADIIERALYNGVMSGISLDGKAFFYENPLASSGSHHRQPWFGCACCPPNIARLLASLGEYIYSTGEDSLAVHLYIGGQAQFEWRGQRVTLRQQTRYPWEGAVQLQIGLERLQAFTLHLRLPGWCRQAQVRVNGQPAAMEDQALGYLRLQREWQDGDQVELVFEMPVERVYAHPAVQQNAGLVALQRGPVVYCLEQVDQTAPLGWIRLPRAAELRAEYEPELLGGVMVLTGQAGVVDETGWQEAIYRSEPPACRPVAIRAVPYSTWDNRAPGAMTVWIPEGDFC